MVIWVNARVRNALHRSYHNPFNVSLRPLIGGVFAGPADQWPQLFGAAQFFNDYPFFLPCAVATLIPLLALLLAFLGLKEVRFSFSREIPGLL